MKKNGLFLALLFVCGVAAAQTPTFEKGDKVLNLGIGFGGNYYSSYSSGYSKTPFLSASLDVGVVDGVFDKGTIGVGGYIGFSSSKWESGNYGWKETDLIIGPRGTLNYPLVEKLDTYAGILLAYHSVTWKETGNQTYLGYGGGSSGIYFSGFIGARYYFSNNFGVMLELGSGGLALASLGVTLKL
ncbi:MAG TPA: hypothetical protein VF298_07640 [Bacteroidales bacterium]